MSLRSKCLFILSALIFLLPCGALSATATVDFSKTNQVIDGFGGSSAWSGKLTDAMMDGLYKNGPTQVGFTILRSRIDPNKRWDDEKSNIQKAKARGATTFATPWSPPASMKTNNNVNNGGQIKSTEWGNYAAYLKEFIDFAGEDLDIISLQNEPDWQPNYESCEWTAAQFRDFCKNYAPSLERPVMMPECLGYNFSMSDPTLDDPAAAANVTYMGGHLYGSGPRKYTKALNLGKHVWETEHYFDNDDAGSCMKLAKEIFDCMNCDFSAYVWWWMTYDSRSGGKEALWVNDAPNHRAWVLAQFSKWVRPGFYRVDATYTPQSGVYVTAFKGNQYVIVALNNSTSAQSVTFSCSNGSFSSVEKYTSSQSKSGASGGSIAVSNNSFSVSLDAQSVTTFVGGSVNVLPLGSADRWYTVETPYRAATPANAAARFMYLINGRRCHIPGMFESGILSPGIYVMPDGASINIRTGNQLRNSGK
jgi:glucuronoarabinoxylan endo-1,4-beta-xylanase